MCNWKFSFLPRLICNWGIFSRRVTARWSRGQVKNQLSTNQNSRYRWCQIVRGTICQGKIACKGRYTYDVHENCVIFKPLPPTLTPTPLTLTNKLWNNNRTVHANEQNKTKTKPSHIIFKLAMHSIRFSPRARQWYH